MLKKLSLSLLFFTFSFFLISEEPNILNEKNQHLNEKFVVKDSLKEEITETSHKIKINDVELHYKAIAGNLLLKNEKLVPKASIFYVAYFKEDVADKSNRPLIFCFNGGPGSAAVWLHMGIFGPRRVLINEDKTDIPPYQIVDNEYSILDHADLVFIDPISTGFSRVALGEDVKQFHGVDEDIESIGEFIRQFLTRYERWDSPKLLAGESYGTTRAAGLAGHLHDEQKIYLNGIILISSALNMQTLYDYSKGNDLPYPLYLPTYTATAWYHKKLPQELQADFNKTLNEVKKFALEDYTLALMKGNTISKEEQKKIIQKLTIYTGLSPEFIERSNMRVNPHRFMMEFLRSKNLTIGRFDTRVVGDALDTSCDYASYDPSFNSVMGAFTAALNHYMLKELQVKKEQEYKILADICNTWNYSKATNQFLNMSGILHDVMTKNGSLKVFVANGYYDLATPFFTSDYTFNHLRLPVNLQNNVSLHYYNGGHMMYLQKDILVAMKNDITAWLKDSEKNQK